MKETKLREVTLSLSPEEATDNEKILPHLRKHPQLKDMDVVSFKVRRKSIDARKKQVKVNLSLLVSDSDAIELPFEPKEFRHIPDDAPQVIIVGAGPAGLFAGLKAIEKGLKPIILERGKDVDSRRLDIAAISREGKIDKDSNYCFGEGGAGAFSDGKLYTRSKKRGNNREVLDLLHQFGASEDILINSHPHIGSDKLPGVIKNIRNKIIECGGEVRFSTRMDSIDIESGRIKGVITSEGEKISGPVFLATGHSSREIYRMLKSSGVKIEPKGLAMGVRLEHPQSLIDRMQYHSQEGRGKYLPAAEYSFVDQADGRGVYSFCMCPGGVIVPAVSDNDQIVVNGMSASARSGKWANSGYVVEIRPEDIKELNSSCQDTNSKVEDKDDPLAMLMFQEYLEKRFSEESNWSLNSPAQRIKDFISGEKSESLPSTSYAPGIHSTDLNKLFPEFIAERLKKGLVQIGKRCKEFVEKDGVMIGLESRTSSPVRIPRDPLTLQHPEMEDLYPVGEGAGYAGGIVSSAVDGMNCMAAYSDKINPARN